MLLSPAFVCGFKELCCCPTTPPGFSRKARLPPAAPHKPSSHLWGHMHGQVCTIQGGTAFLCPLQLASSLCPLLSFADPTIHGWFMPRKTGVTMTLPRPSSRTFRQPPVLGMWPPESSSDGPLFPLPRWPAQYRASTLDTSHRRQRVHVARGGPDAWELCKHFPSE